MIVKRIRRPFPEFIAPLGRGRDGDCLPPAQIPACAANAPGSTSGRTSGGSRRCRRSVRAHPPFRSTQRSGSESGLWRPDGCSPWLRPFPPRLPPEAALLCSVASSVLWPHPTSHPRACSACGLWPSRADPNQGPGIDEISQVPYKGRPRVHGVSDCARSLPCKPPTLGADVAFSSAERDRHLGIRPVSQLNTQPVVSHG